MRDNSSGFIRINRGNSEDYLGEFRLLSEVENMGLVEMDVDSGSYNS